MWLFEGSEFFAFFDVDGSDSFDVPPASSLELLFFDSLAAFFSALAFARLFKNKDQGLSSDFSLVMSEEYAYICCDKR